MKNALRAKRVVVFDLDGTLVKSKLPLDRSMAVFLSRLLRNKKAAIIGGGKFGLFEKQLLEHLHGARANFENLFLFPTNGSSLFRYRNGWRKVYELRLSKSEIKKVKTAFAIALIMTGFERPAHSYGHVIENRRTQVTFSALGQKAPLAIRKRWNRTEDTRPRIARVLRELLPKFEVSIGGLTSIDVTKKGIDKAYAIRKLMKMLKVQKRDVLFVGDALFPGGNDYSAKSTGVMCIRVKNLTETKRVIGKVLSQ
jgi:HAD superfamily hydrolase (TIGR01484 family)